MYLLLCDTLTPKRLRCGVFVVVLNGRKNELGQLETATSLDAQGGRSLFLEINLYLTSYLENIK